MTDVVLTFADRDPAVDGIGITAGGTVEIVLPDDFVNTAAGDNTVVILQGWPQSPIVPFPYTTQIDGNRITLTLTSDFLPGTAGPGPKQLHLILLGFTNPEQPGRYPVSLTVRPDASSQRVLSGTASVQIIPRSRPSANVVPVGVLRVDFAPDPDVSGEYQVLFRMNGGNEQRIVITVVE